MAEQKMIDCWECGGWGREYSIVGPGLEHDDPCRNCEGTGQAQDRRAIPASTASADEKDRDFEKARGAFLRLRKWPRQSTLDVVCDLDDLDEYFDINRKGG